MNELQAAFSELFPLADKSELPQTPDGIRDFLVKRLEFEAERRTQHAFAEIALVLLQASPFRSHPADMARMVVEEAKSARRMRDEICRLRKKVVLLEGEEKP